MTWCLKSTASLPIFACIFRFFKFLPRFHILQFPDFPGHWEPQIIVL